MNIRAYGSDTRLEFNKSTKYALAFAAAVLSVVLFRIIVIYAVKKELVMDFITISGAIISALPYYAIKYYEYYRLDRIEERFPDFLRDLSGARHSGMTLPHAVLSVARLNYGYLTGEIKKIAQQISWGVPFDKTLERFSQRNPSKYLQRASSIIIEADRSGGNISAILESVAEHSKMMREIEREQKGMLRTYTLIIYLAFVILLAVLVMLINTLITGLVGLGGLVSPTRLEEFKVVLYHMSLLQGAFTGLVAGKVGEGSILDGIKHSLVMILFAFAAFRMFVW